MNYIIDPMIFYWIEVIHNLGDIAICLFTISFVGFFILLGSVVGDWYCDDDDMKKGKIAMKWTLVATIVFGLIMIFSPSKQTMIEMLVAKYATVDNAEWTADALKSLVDYIVQTVQAIK